MEMTITKADLVCAPGEVVDQYWEQRVSALKAEVDAQLESGEKVDPTLGSLSELLDASLAYDQYKKPSEDFEETTRIVKLRIRMPRQSIENCFGLKTISMYGVGLFAPVEGLLVSEWIRRKTNYDDCVQGKKGANFDLSRVPEEYQRNYEFRLAVPAMGGLFVPKKCDMTQGWISRTSQIQYFDIML